MGDSTTLLATSFQIVSRLAGIFLFLMLPLFITISIARTKLFDIDLIINRSLVYGILTIGLGLTFAAGAWLDLGHIQEYSSGRPILSGGDHFFGFGGRALSAGA